MTNCAFGGDDLQTLYITAGGTIYSIRTSTPGRACGLHPNEQPEHTWSLSTIPGYNDIVASLPLMGVAKHHLSKRGHSCPCRLHARSCSGSTCHSSMGPKHAIVTDSQATIVVARTYCALQRSRSDHAPQSGAPGFALTCCCTFGAKIEWAVSNGRTLVISSSPQLHGLPARRVPPEFLAFVGGRAFQGLSRNGFAFAVADFELVVRNRVDFDVIRRLLGIDCNIHLNPPSDFSQDGDFLIRLAHGNQPGGELLIAFNVPEVGELAGLYFGRLGSIQETLPAILSSISSVTVADWPPLLARPLPML